MSSSNSRLVEKNIFRGLYIATQGGDSVTVDMNFATKFSLQSIFDVTTFTNKTFTDTDVDTTANTITITAHGFTSGLAITLTTSSTLPAPLAISTTYYVIPIDANTIKLASSLVLAIAGTAIDITTAGGVAATQTVIPTAIACYFTLYGSNAPLADLSDSANWTQLQFRTDVVTDGSTFYEDEVVSNRYFKVVKTITAGSAALTCNILVIGDGV